MKLSSRSRLLLAVACALAPASACGSSELVVDAPAPVVVADSHEPAEPEPEAEMGPMCGGIAARPCPGEAVCVDDPRDDCAPRRGGADCGGVCRCDARPLCAPGSTFDASPDVCACVEGVAHDDVCARVRCMAGTRCVPRGGSAECVPDQAR